LITLIIFAESTNREVLNSAISPVSCYSLSPSQAFSSWRCSQTSLDVHTSLSSKDRISELHQIISTSLFRICFPSVTSIYTKRAINGNEIMVTELNDVQMCIISTRTEPKCFLSDTVV